MSCSTARYSALLSLRQSLQTVLLENEKRFKAKGHGFRTAAVVEENLRQHTVDMLGGLLDRVQELSKQHEVWQTRFGAMVAWTAGSAGPRKWATQRVGLHLQEPRGVLPRPRYL